MANGEARRTERGNWLAAGVALLTVVLFLGWLVTRRDPEQVAVAEPDQSAATNADDANATAITMEELNDVNRVNALRGQSVRIARGTAIAAMGPHLFWMELPGGSPFLVKLDSALVASGAQAPTSGEYEIVGRVLEKTNAVIDQWLQSGVLRDDNDKIQAEFGSSYIEARRVRPAAG